jgi:hypothetical protein
MEDIDLWAMIGWVLESLPAEMVMLSVSYAANSDELRSRTAHTIRLAMPAAECRKLAEALLAEASHSERGHRNATQ